MICLTNRSSSAASLVAGAFCRTPGGWRNMFWVQAALQILVSACFFIFYWPPKSTREFPKMNISQIIWACDPIGSTLYIGGATSVLMALNWGSGLYPWSNPRVAAPLAIGLFCLALFGVYGMASEISRKASRIDLSLTTF
jgi:hypothetical protein